MTISRNTCDDKLFGGGTLFWAVVSPGLGSSLIGQCGYKQRNFFSRFKKPFFKLNLLWSVLTIIMSSILPHLVSCSRRVGNVDVRCTHPGHIFYINRTHPPLVTLKGRCNIYYPFLDPISDSESCVQLCSWNDLQILQ